LAVIKGSKDQLANILALQTEISIKAIYYGMPNYLESIAALEALDFGISGIFPNNPASQFPHTFKFGCIMVNKALVS
jgi:hypothetical protein